MGVFVISAEVSVCVCETVGSIAEERYDRWMAADAQEIGTSSAHQPSIDPFFHFYYSLTVYSGVKLVSKDQSLKWLKRASPFMLSKNFKWNSDPSLDQ